MPRLSLLLATAFWCAGSLLAQAPAGGGRVYVVSYIDANPQTAADASKALTQFAQDSRKDAGSVRFEVFRDIARANHFTMVESWQSREAYEKHLAQDYAKRFREKMQPYLGSPFDERLYFLLE